MKRALNDPFNPGVYALLIRASGVAPSWERSKWTRRSRREAAAFLRDWRAKTNLAHRLRHLARMRATFPVGISHRDLRFGRIVYV